MGQDEFIRETISRLEKLGLDYCITGSIASNFYGMPRFTHDLDIITIIKDEDIKSLVETFGKDSYIDDRQITEAIRDKRMFNVIHHQTGLKVDFWLLKDDEFSRNLFSRRQRVELISGLSAWLARPEDIVISKLLWNKITTSERQLDDVKGILEVQSGRLDMDYLRHWTGRLSVSNTFKELLQAPPPNRY